jgi:hypothetical protein
MNMPRIKPTRHGFCLLAWGLAFGLVTIPLAASTNAAAKAKAASDEFFTSGAIPHLHIEIDATNLNALRRNARAYVRATVHEGDKVYEEVGIHLKGAAGSFQQLDGVPALTLNFDKFRDHQKFHGLDKLHLNNSVQDRSLMCEAICARLFLEAGVPTARSGHARVTLNGRDLGLYVLKEGYDKEFLRRHFKSDKGNLYDGGFIRDVTDDLEKKSGEDDVPKRSDLKALAAAAQEPDVSRRLERLEKVFDVDRFLSFIALEIMTWHWDGYMLKKNNYRVYHDPSVDKIVFIPHGMDQMFWEANQPIIRKTEEIQGLVARSLLETSDGRRRYRARVGSLVTNLFTAEKLTNHLNELQSRLRPALEAIGKDRVREWQGAADDVRRKVLARAEFLQRRTSEPEPKPLKFDAAGYAKLGQWNAADSKQTGTLNQPTDADGTKTLHIIAGTNCVASWRTYVFLARGRYVFEGRVRTAGVVPLKNETTKKGLGAGLRHSRVPEPRANNVVGDSDWQKIEYEFTINDETEEPWLICELRASKGEAWFDLASLRLRRR